MAILGAGLLAFTASSPPAASAATVRSGSISAVVHADPFTLRFEQRRGRPLIQSPLGGGARPGSLGFRTALGWAHATRASSLTRSGDSLRAVLATNDPLGRAMELTLAPAPHGAIALHARVTGLPGAEATGIGFVSPAGERFYGFGERSNAVDQRGHEVENYVSDGPTPEEDRLFVAPITPIWGERARDDATYYPVPWALSSRGYGVLIDRDETSRFELASDRADTWSLDVDGGALDLRVFAGPTPAKALRGFTAATGRQPRSPAPWTYGPWFQTGQPNVVPLEEERAIIDTLREADAPASAAETQMHFLPCGAQVGRESYIAARGKQFHRAGLAHLAYFNPLLCVSYGAVYDAAARAGVLQEGPVAGLPFIFPAFVGGDGSAGFTVQPLAQFDFTAPGAIDFYRGLIGAAYAAGYDGWMEDFGEYTAPVVQSADGTPASQIHNRYPTDYHCAVARIVRSLKRPLTRHQRSGWTGSARCADIVWGGDPTTRWGFDGLSSTVTQALGIGMSGVARWGSDIGGYFSFGAEQPRPPGLEQPKLTPELLKRWIEVGAASAVMRTKRSGIAIPSYERPQIFDPDVLPVWRRYAKLHTQLYPYLRAADRAYRRTGMPIMRHLALSYPGDRRALAQDDEYLFGPDLLAAPVLAPDQRDRTLYAPSGRWVDWWRSVSYRDRSGGLRLGAAKLLRGGRKHTLPAPLRELPLLARTGSLFAMLPPDVDTLSGYGGSAAIVHLAQRRDRMRLLAFPRGRSSARFYSDERLISGEGKRAWKLRVNGARARSYGLQASLATLRHPFRPCRVTLGGRPLPARRWTYSTRTKVLRARFHARSITLRATPCRTTP